MQIKPCKRNLLVKFYQPETALLATPRVLDANAAKELRTRVRIIEISEMLEKEDEFIRGQFLLLRPNPAILVISEPDALGLIDSAVVEAIVLDDEEI